MTYPGRDRPALDRLSLTIGPGELIMLTGPSGAGKTTVLRLLLRFVEPTSGTVRVGGTDLAAVPVEPWRAQIAWVPQHPRLFDGSVADNIALGQPGASRAAIEDAARLAGAAAFIEALPRGYDTRWKNAPPGCRPGSASSSPWRGRSCGTPRCCCSTSRPPT